MDNSELIKKLYNYTISENWHALITFQQIIALNDRNFVGLTSQRISSITGIPIELIKTGVEYLNEHCDVIIFGNRIEINWDIVIDRYSLS